MLQPQAAAAFLNNRSENFCDEAPIQYFQLILSNEYEYF